MKVTVRKDRNLIIVNARNTQNENDVETIEITVPEEYENFNKKIAFITDDGVVWDFIENNKYTLTNAITKYKKVKFYIWLTQDNKDFRSEERTIVFNKNQDANEEVTEEEISGFNKMINILEEEITEVTGLQEDLTNLINTVQTKLDNGDFVGPQGPQGEPGESYDDTEIKEEISDIKEEQLTQNTNIETLQNQVEDLEEQVAELENNQLTGTATGQIIYIEDSTNTKVRSIGLSGNSEQESTTGKNIAYVTSTVGDKITFDDSQIITYSSGATASNFVNLEQNTLEANQEYIFEMFLTSTTQNTAQSELVLRDINNTVLFDIYRTINNSSLYYSYNFTPTADTTLYRLQLYNNASTPLTADIKFKLQIRKANTTGGYEPYTGGQASPNPSYPQEIHSTGDSGSVNEKVQNKNIIKITNEINATNQGVVITGDEENQVVKFKGTITNTYCNSGVLYLSEPISTGIFRANFKANCDAFIVLVGKNTAWLRSMQSSSSTNIVVDVSTLSEPVIGLRFGIEHLTSGANIDYEVGYQLTKGSELTSYVPHAEQTLSFPLAQGQKLMQGDYLADDGIHHVRGEADLKDLTWTYTSDGNRFLCNNVSNLNIKGTTSDSIPSTQILSNVFKIYSNNGLVSTFNPVNYGIAITTTGLIRAKYTDTTDVNTFVSMLTNTNAILQYELAEEVIEPYTEEQQAVWEQIKALRTYKPVTHISSTDEVPATVDVTYVKDLETVINNLGGA